MSKDKKPKICAPSLGTEYTLCGDAFDAYESGDSDAPIVIAKMNQTVTCPKCRNVIVWVKMNFKNFRYLNVPETISAPF